MKKGGKSDGSHLFNKYITVSKKCELNFTRVDQSAPSRKALVPFFPH